MTCNILKRKSSLYLANRSIFILWSFINTQLHSEAIADIFAHYVLHTDWALVFALSWHKAAVHFSGISIDWWRLCVCLCVHFHPHSQQCERMGLSGGETIRGRSGQYTVIMADLVAGGWRWGLFWVSREVWDRRWTRPGLYLPQTWTHMLV